MPEPLPNLDDVAAPKRGPGRPSKAAGPTTKAAPPPPPAGKDRGPGRPSKAEKFEDRLGEFFAELATGVTMLGVTTGNPTLQTDGLIIGAGAEPMAQAWARLAEENPRIRAALERMMTGSAWTAVILSTGSVVRAVVENHAQAAAARRLEAEAEAEAAAESGADPVAA